MLTVIFHPQELDFAPARARRQGHRQQDLGHHEDGCVYPLAHTLGAGAAKLTPTATSSRAEREFVGKLLGFDDYVSESQSCWCKKSMLF